MLDKKFQIFISSTYTDLLEERQAAVESILRCGHIPAGMELFSAGNETQLEVIKRWIDDSDIYVLILGGRYGSIEPKFSLSYTEIEYDYAVSIGKPLFAIVLSDNFIEAKVAIDGTKALERFETIKLKSFKDKVLSRISTIVEDLKDIKLGITNSIFDLQRRHQLVGWVKANESTQAKTNTSTTQQFSANKNTQKFELIESFPSQNQPVTLEQIGRMFLKFSNPIDRNTACFIGILQIRENAFYQWDNSGGIRYSEENSKLTYLMMENLREREPQYSAIDEEFYRFEIHLGRGHPDTLLRDIYGNTLPHTIIPVYIKRA